MGCIMEPQCVCGFHNAHVAGGQIVGGLLHPVLSQVTIYRGAENLAKPAFQLGVI